MKKGCIRAFQEATSERHLPIRACAVCAQLTSDKDSTLLSSEDKVLERVRSESGILVVDDCGRVGHNYRVCSGNNFGMFPGNYEEMSKHWTESLKVQERRLKLKECGSEAVGDIEDDDEEDDNEDNKGENSEGARLEFTSRQVCTSWEEAWDSVVEELSFNEKQRCLLMLIAKKFSKETTEVTGKQILSYLGGEGGTGKSRVIHGVKLLVEKMGRRDLLQLAGASGSAADNINGSTAHSCLGLEIRKSNVAGKGKMPDKVPSDGRLKTLKRLWKKKQILIIDEISMVNQRTLYEIDRKC